MSVVSMGRSSWCSQVRSSFRVVRRSSSRVSRVSLSRSSSSSPRRPSRQDRTRCCILLSQVSSAFIQLLLTLLTVDCLFPLVLQGQQISVQGQQVAQTADGQTIVYQPVNADGTVLQQGKLNFPLQPFSLFSLCFLDLKTTLTLFAGMITIPAASLAGAQIVQAGGTSTNTTNSNQGTVTVTLPVSGNMVNAGGMVMVRPCAEVPNILLLFISCKVTQGVWSFIGFFLNPLIRTQKFMP